MAGGLMPENWPSVDGRAEKPERGCVTQRPALARRHCLPGDGGADGGGEVIRAEGWGPCGNWSLRASPVGVGEKEEPLSLLKEESVTGTEWETYPGFFLSPTSNLPPGHILGQSQPDTSWQETGKCNPRVEPTGQ